MVYNTNPYSSFAKASKMEGREVQIIGELIVDKPIEENIENNALVFTFYMTDGHGGQSQVTYFGPRPNDFEKLENVVIVGKYINGTFLATRLLLKCPSKYREDALEQQTTSQGENLPKVGY